MKNRNILLPILVVGIAFLATTKAIRDKKYTERLQSSLIATQQHLKESEDTNTKIRGEIEELKKSNDNLREDLKASLIKIQQMEGDVYYNSEDVTLPSNATQYHMTKALKGTPLVAESNTFIEAEKEYGVNALFLAGIVANESSWGTSSRAINQNNLSGYAVYSRGATGAIFDSWKDSILATAKLLAKDYLTSNGECFNGKSVEGVNTLYCQNEDGTDYTWSTQVDSIAKELQQKINSR